MHDDHILRRQFHLKLIQDISVLQSDVVRFIEETLFLNAGHVEKCPASAWRLPDRRPLQREYDSAEHIVSHKSGIRSSSGEISTKADIFITNQSRNQRVHRTAELQISAQPDSQIAESAFLRMNRQKIGQV